MLMRTQHRRAVSGLSAKVPPGSKSGAGCTREVRQEPGRSCVSVDNSGGPPKIGSGSTRAVLVRDGSEQEHDDGNQRVKATKRGAERTTGSRSSP
jgi:hypothetical protein